jgi:hypothetical protein
MAPQKNPRTNKRWLSKRALNEGYREQSAWQAADGRTHVVTLEAVTVNGITDYIVKHMTEEGWTAHGYEPATISTEGFSFLDEARSRFTEESKR